MKVVFDHQIFSRQRRGGVSRYFCELARGLAEDGIQASIHAPLHVNSYLGSLPRAVHRGYLLPEIAGDWTIAAAANAALNRISDDWRSGADVFHETYYGKPRASPRSGCAVLTVFDMIHEKFPADFKVEDPTRRLKAEAVARADHVICISECTRRDLIGLYGIPASKTSVVYLGGGLTCPPPHQGRSAFTGTPFLLYVGGRRGYKNFSSFLRAFARSASLRDSHAIISYGGGSPHRDESALIAELGLDPRRINFLEGSDEILSKLYSTATALVYPSRYEGFGLPPLEAMSHACPVICSRGGSLPEVVGTAAETFDAADIEALSAAMERVVGNPEHAAALASLGLVRAREFSWTKCARETRNVYHRILGT